MMTPYEAITADPPNVWLTSFYGFNPAQWGYLGFSTKGQRDHFIKNTQPGVLVVIYGHKSKAPANQQGQVIGIQQVSHRVNSAQAFMDPAVWAAKEADAVTKGKWDLGVKATRAWKVVPESYELIDNFANESYSTDAAQFIGSQGKRLTPAEAIKILDLTLIETSVFGERSIDAAVPVNGEELLRSSKPGPVSQTGYTVKEAEGPKENYILQLNGDLDAFLGRPALGRKVVKVGMSVSPSTRMDAFNAALPACAFKWSIHRSNSLDGRAPYASSKLGLRGEEGMKQVMAAKAEWLGGEFYLASQDVIDAAWAAGIKRVEDFSIVY
ncbi:hypothetical protein [Falsirhodobacter sp. 20TX0035]|uniref:hypothetical protein n=1 Tax=Falsirhodobacter sp. 20TX0035 TaxID=3022019 RepID=UPI00232B97E2|nr:hypothetical protein [Falsirhodobacter sp. 20TX0035]MDB6455162.1 hypothetical protein [Falsirhodobacter sp. 20TX0035]